MAVYSENHMKPINTLSGKNTELLNGKAGGTYSCQLSFKGLVSVWSLIIIYWLEFTLSFSMCTYIHICMHVHTHTKYSVQYVHRYAFEVIMK
jgi:hypothetical protein